MTGLGRALLVAGSVSLCSSAVFAQVPDEPRVEDVFVPIEPPKPELPKTDIAEPGAVEPALNRALDVPKGFCKNASRKLASGEIALCDVASAAAARCPGFAAACERAIAELTKGSPRSASGSGNDSGSGSGTGRRSRRSLERGERGERGDGSDDDGSEDGPSWETSSSSPLGDALGGIVTVIVWGLLALGIGAMLVVGLRALFGKRREKDSAPEASGGATVERPQRPLVTGSPEELLERAREAARRGELGAGMALVLRALLRHLEIGGALELHHSRTNGDYVRSLRRGGHRVDDLRRVAAEVEAIEFGGGKPSPEAFTALHQSVSKLVHVASVTLLCLLLGLVSGCRKKAPSENAVNSCGSGATGYSALCETLAARGVKVRRRFTSVEMVAEEVTRVVVLEDAIDEAERTMLLDWVAKGGTLVVFDPSKAYDGFESSAQPACGEELSLDPAYWNVPPESKRRMRLPGARSFEAPGTTRLAVRCGDRPFVLESSRGLGTIVAIADARLPMNASLAIEQNAALVTTLVGPPGSTVELIGGWTGTGADLPLESLLRSGLLPWFLQILVLGLAIALYRGSPFGTRREPVSVTRRAFAEHAIALGDAYSRAHASRIALLNFGAFALERLRLRMQATKHGRLTDLAGAVAARHGVSESEVMSLVVAVRSAEDPAHDSATEVEHLAALRRLSTLVKTTGGSS